MGESVRVGDRFSQRNHRVGRVLRVVSVKRGIADLHALDSPFRKTARVRTKMSTRSLLNTKKFTRIVGG